MGVLGILGLLCGPIYTMRAYFIDIGCVGRPTSIKWANKRESSMFYIRKIQFPVNYRGLYGNSGPLGLLSGPMYRIKLLSVLFLVTPIYTSTHAKRIIHVPFRLNKTIW